MRKIRLWALLLLVFFGAAPLAASEADDANAGLLHSLQANRSLLLQYQNELLELKSKAAGKPSDTLKRKISQLEEKIKILTNDSDELLSFLSVKKRAREFLTDLMVKKIDTEKRKQSQAAEELLQTIGQKNDPRRTSGLTESAWQMHERALECVSNQNYKEALALYEQIILKNPDDDEAYIIMGHTYLLTGQYQKAERAFHNAVSIDPQNINEIAPFYENMALQNPDDDQAYANLGYAYLILGDPVRASDAFRNALSINPDNVAANKGAGFMEQLAKNN